MTLNEEEWLKTHVKRWNLEEIESMALTASLSENEWITAIFNEMILFDHVSDMQHYGV